MEQRIAALAVEAVRDHGVCHQTILSAIRDALEEASKGLPDVRVLINACHGGFGLSRTFTAWNAARAGGDDEEDERGEERDPDVVRVRLAGRMEAFGAHVLARHPSVAAIVSALGSPGGRALKAALLGAGRARAAREVLANIDANLRTLEAAIAYAGFPWEGTQTTMTNYTLLADRHDVLGGYRLKKHSRESAQAFYDALDAEQLRREYVVLADDAVWSADLPPELAAAIAAHRDPPKMRCEGNACFMDSLVAAERDASAEATVRAWSCFPRYDASAAAFLAGVLAADDGGTVHRFFFGSDSAAGPCDDETVGLLAAGDANARLAIEAVPRLAGWTVGDYDGLEHVIIH
jgi:hypothetical protein